MEKGSPKRDSFAIKGTIMRAAMGSVHQRLKRIFRAKPASKIADRWAQKSARDALKRSPYNFGKAQERRSARCACWLS